MNISKIDYTSLIEKYQSLIISAADSIWEFAETAFQEHRSSSLLKSILEEQGFSISAPSEKLPTAFTARWGYGRPILGFLGEYDALPGLSQKADIAAPAPTSSSAGHGCGHNLLGCGVLAGVLFLKDIMEQKKLANHRVYYTFHGTSAHASRSPHLGRSALDACELMNVGVNYLREHMIDEARVHYAYTDTVGTAHNIIPSRSQVFYAVRAPKSGDGGLLRERVDDIARGAALMTGTSVDIETACVYDSFLPNPVLDQLVLKYLKLYTPVHSPGEEAYARDFLSYGNLPEADRAFDDIPDLSITRKTGISTDVGNVSQILPCTAFMLCCYANGSPLHHWTVTAQGKSSAAHKGMLAAGKILSSCALELLTEPGLLLQVQKAFHKAKGIYTAAP